MKKKTHLSFIIVLLTLAGCSSMNNQFECPLKYGVMCHSLDEVNAMVDEKGVETPSQTKITKPVIVKTSSHPKPQGFSSVRETSLTQIRVVEEPQRSHPLTPIGRQPEKILRVWIAPFEDTDGIYHEASHVWMVTAPSVWHSTLSL